MAPRKIVFNGVDGTTGKYLVPPQNVNVVAKAARRGQRPARRRRTRGLPFDFPDPADFANAGWAVVFHKEEPAAVKTKVQALIDHRGKTVKADRLKVLEYQKGEGAREWLNRHETDFGSVTPTKVPYYLLVIGPPERIPFEFTQDLAAEYVIGRLSFDTPDEYGHYIESLKAYEEASRIENAKEAVFFGTRHDFDAATQLSADYLLKPLVTSPRAHSGKPVCETVGFRPRLTVGATAKRDELCRILRGTRRSPQPSLVFTATHGVGFASGDERQHAAQGALLCQDWPAAGQIDDAHYLSADAVPADARLSGLVAILFACYGAGTPHYDRFWRGERKSPPVIAPSPFIAALPRKLLAHPGGGALACIGHVERAWGNAIVNADAGPQLQLWQNLVGRILSGQPIGLALRDMNERYAALSAMLSRFFDDEERTGTPVEEYKLAETWLDWNDAGGYVLLGDPAAQLRPAQLA